MQRPQGVPSLGRLDNLRPPTSETNPSFSQSAHPIRFESATGLTPHLTARKVAAVRRSREDVPQTIFTFGKNGQSRDWLTPRAGNPGRSQHASGAQTDRAGRPSQQHGGGGHQTSRQHGQQLRPMRSKPVRGLRSTQGLTWRFLREKPEAPRQATTASSQRTSTTRQPTQATNPSGPLFGIEEDPNFSGLLQGGGKA